MTSLCSRSKGLKVTAKTKAHHEMLVEEFKSKIEETKAEIAEKQQAIQDTADSIALADKEYAVYRSGFKMK